MIRWLGKLDPTSPESKVILGCRTFAAERLRSNANIHFGSEIGPEGGS